MRCFDQDLSTQGKDMSKYSVLNNSQSPLLFITIQNN